jgi:hypothetical protein
MTVLFKKLILPFNNTVEITISSRINIESALFDVTS